MQLAHLQQNASTLPACDDSSLGDMEAPPFSFPAPSQFGESRVQIHTRGAAILLEEGYREKVRQEKDRTARAMRESQRLEFEVRKLKEEIEQAHRYQNNQKMAELQ